MTANEQLQETVSQMTDPSPTSPLVVVFLGPTMPVAAAREVLPDAHYLPQARQSDILSVVDQLHPAAILLIDGVFTQELSVWHKEILYALERGVAVYGASSMGARRVAETAVFGAVGVGAIYRAYASGELTDDDEVAVTVASAEFGHRALSDAMVNIRASLSAAAQAGVIDQPTHDQLVALAKARFFPERTYAALLADAAAAGIDPGTVAGLRAFLATNAVDAKRRDATELLQLIAEQGITAPPPVVTTRSHPFLALYHRDRRVARAGPQVPRADISSYAALHLEDFRELNEAALHAALVDVLAEMLHVQPTADEVAAERERFARDRHLDAAGLAAFQAANDLTDPEFDDLLTRMAGRRRLREWLISRKYLERTTQEVLEWLVLAGRYPQVADATAFQQDVLEGAHPDFEFRGDDDTILELVRDHARHTGWRPTAQLDAWAFESGFKDVSDVRYELVRAKLARAATAAALDSLRSH
jgi:hypothetical protein